MQPGGERLLVAHEVIPRPKLPAMSVARQLHIETGGSGCRCRPWLMRQQDANGVLGRALQRGRRVTAMHVMKVMRAEIGDTCQHESGTGVLQHDVLVEQNVETEAPQLANPGRGTRVVL